MSLSSTWETKKPIHSRQMTPKGEAWKKEAARPPVLPKLTTNHISISHKHDFINLDHSLFVASPLRSSSFPLQQHASPVLFSPPSATMSPTSW